jgi:hypothetical protein
MDHTFRALTIAVGSVVSYIGSVSVIAQTTMPPELANGPTMQLLEKGGGWAVLIVVLWAYRRDYKRLSENEAMRVKQILEVANNVAEAEKAVAVSLAAHTEVLREIKERLK